MLTVDGKEGAETLRASFATSFCSIQVDFANPTEAHWAGEACSGIWGCILAHIRHNPAVSSRAGEGRAEDGQG